MSTVKALGIILAPQSSLWVPEYICETMTLLAELVGAWSLIAIGALL